MFEITIKQKRIEEVPEGREWKTLETRLLSEKDVEGSYYTREDYQKRLKEGEIIKMEVKGYTPEILKKNQVETVIYNQTLEEIDLQAVIKAINGIS